MENKKKKGLMTQWERLVAEENKSFPVCTHAFRDCINIDVSGKCRALTSTKFNRECPFYRCWREVSAVDLQYFMHNDQALNHYRLMKAMLYANLDKSYAATPPVKAFRVRAGFKQGQVAEHLGISRGLYGEKEKDPKRFTLGEAYRLSRLLRVSVYDLFPEREEQEGAK